MEKPQNIEVVGEIGGVIVKVVVGSVGMATVGPVGALAATLASELVGLVIPNLRRDRVEKFINELALRVASLEEQQLKARFLQPEFIDIFEDGCLQASRALTEERISQIATFIRSTLSVDQFEYAHDKRLLSLLSELNAVELIILQSYAKRNQHSDDFEIKHPEVFGYDRLTGGASEDDDRKGQIINAYRNPLIALGLIGPSGGSGLYLTVLGNELLRKMDLEDSDAYVYGEPVSPYDALEASNDIMRSFDSL